MVDGEAETEFFQVDFSDYLAASEAVDSERPTGTSDGREVFDWLEAMDGRDGSALYVSIPRGFGDGVAEVSEYREEVGFAIPEAPRLSDDADLLAVARVLDEHNVVGTTVIRDNFSVSEVEQLEDLSAIVVDELAPIKPPFETVGIGWAVADGEATVEGRVVVAELALATDGSPFDVLISHFSKDAPFLHAP